MSEPAVVGGRIALVTGAGSGIGRACALGLLRDGWSVVLVGRNLDHLEETVAQWPEKGRTLLRSGDVADPDFVAVLFETIRLRFGRLDLLFNNAGVAGPRVPIEEVTVEDWRRTVDINVSGYFFCIQEAFRLMKTQEPKGGRIINNGSLSAHTPRCSSSPYTVTKHAITGLTKSAALEGREVGIACGQIDIGNAETPMTRPGRASQPDGTTPRTEREPMMDVVHVVDALLYMANLPLGTTVLSMTVMATKMPFIGRG